MSIPRTIGTRVVVAGIVALLLGGALAGQAQEPLDDRVREVAAQLRCPVCQNLSVADSPSEMAREMRAVVREQLAAGRTPEEVKAYFLAKYGDWILLSPRARGVGLLVWLGPVAAAVAGLLAVGLAVRRWTRPRARPAAPAPDPSLLAQVRREALEEEVSAEAPAGPLDAERRRLYAALREFDFDHRAGKLSDEDYASMRQEYEGRAATALAALARAPRAPAPTADPEPALPGPPPARRSRRGWGVAVAGASLLVLGVAVGALLSGSLRPRPPDSGSPTGDFLTGTGPGGVSPDSAESMARAEIGARRDPVGPGRMPGPVAAKVREYRARLEKDPRDLEALLGMGELNLQRQDLGQAIDYYRRALDVDPGNAEALVPLGLILQEAGHVEPALAALERALARKPDHPLALWGKGLVLSEGKRDYAGAIRAWERLLAANPDLPPADAEQVAKHLVEARKKLAPASRPEARPAPSAPTPRPR